MLFYEYYYFGTKPVPIQIGNNSKVVEPNSNFLLAADKMNLLSQVTKVGNVRFVRMVEKDVKKPKEVQSRQMDLNTNIKRDYEDANKVQRSRFNERRLRSIDERAAYMDAKLKKSQEDTKPKEVTKESSGRNNGKRKLAKKAVLVNSNIKRIIQKNDRETVKKEKIVAPETVFDTDVIKDEESDDEAGDIVEKEKDEVLVEDNSEVKKDLQEDEFGPLKGTEAWDKLSHGEKIRIGVARKNNTIEDKENVEEKNK